MQELRFFECDALISMMSLALERSRSRRDASTVIDAIGTNVADATNDAITELLRNDPRLATVTSIEFHSVMSSDKIGFGVHYRNVKKDGQIVQMRFYRVRESWVASALSLAGLTVGIALLSPGVVIPVVSLLRTIWKSLITLDAERNSEAIHAYQALLAAKLNNESIENSPTLSDINGNLQLGVSALIGLQQLRDLGLVEVANWADRQGDYSNELNRWRIVI